MVKLWKKAVSLTVVLGVLFSMSMVSFASDRGSSPSVGSSASVGSSSSAASSDTVFGVSSDTKGV